LRRITKTLIHEPGDLHIAVVEYGIVFSGNICSKNVLQLHESCSFFEGTIMSTEEIKYEVEMLTDIISIDEYVSHFLDVDLFVSCCRQCPNYGTVWSCPPFDFEAADYWKEYDSFEVYLARVIIDPAAREVVYGDDEINDIGRRVLQKEKNALMKKLLKKENAPDRISLLAGNCRLCGEGNCARKTNEPCRHPEKMRYSIEALGGNVEKMIKELFGYEMLWAHNGRLPEYYLLTAEC